MTRFTFKTITRFIVFLKISFSSIIMQMRFSSWMRMWLSFKGILNEALKLKFKRVRAFCWKTFYKEILLKRLFSFTPEENNRNRNKHGIIFSRGKILWRLKSDWRNFSNKQKYKKTLLCHSPTQSKLNRSFDKFKWRLIEEWNKLLRHQTSR